MLDNNKKNNNCIFCKIITGEIPAKKIYEDEEIIAFNDINPQAPVHFLVVPKTHIESLDYINEFMNLDIVAYLIGKIPEIAKEQNIINGYRVITNIGEDGGQSVKHLHFHVLGGAKLGERLV